MTKVKTDLFERRVTSTTEPVKPFRRALVPLYGWDWNECVLEAWQCLHCLNDCLFSINNYLKLTQQSVLLSGVLGVLAKLLLSGPSDLCCVFSIFQEHGSDAVWASDRKGVGMLPKSVLQSGVQLHARMAHKHGRFSHPSFVPSRRSRDCFFCCLWWTRR